MLGPSPRAISFASVQHVHLPGEQAGSDHQQHVEQYRVQMHKIITRKAARQPEQHGIERFLSITSIA